MTIKVEINANDCQLIRRQVNGDKGPREMLEQRAYLHTDGAYPIPFKVSLRNPSEAYASGFYTISPESFKVNQYGNLELSRFDFKLLPLIEKPAPRAAGAA
jgi:hypothetical protein